MTRSTYECEDGLGEEAWERAMVGQTPLPRPAPVPRDETPTVRPPSRPATVAELYHAYNAAHAVRLDPLRAAEHEDALRTMEAHSDHLRSRVEDEERADREWRARNGSAA